MNHVAEADATEVQLLKVSNFVRKQKGTAISSFCAAIASPFLFFSYMAYRRKNMPQESQQSRSSKSIKKQ